MSTLSPAHGAINDACSHDLEAEADTCGFSEKRFWKENNTEAMHSHKYRLTLLTMSQAQCTHVGHALHCSLACVTVDAHWSGYA